MKEETKFIDGVLYCRYDYQHFWYDNESGNDIVCGCGNKHFTVRYSDNYETSAKCTSCGKEDVVHSG